MKRLPIWVIHFNLIVIIIMGSWFDVTAAKSLEVFVVWIFIALGVVCVMTDYEKKYKGMKLDDLSPSIVTRLAVCLEIILLAASGSIITAWVYLVVACLAWIRRGNDLDKLRRKMVAP